MIYGYTCINSDGWYDSNGGGESRTYLFSSKEKCIEDAFNRYCAIYDVFLEEDIESEKESEEEFIKNVNEDKIAGYIQLPSSHIQFEFFELEGILVKG